MNEHRAALLIVDVQVDYCPGGALQVPDGDRVIGPINRAVECFVGAGLPILASRDCHPPTSRHFRPFGGAWPVHCVSGTEGAAFHPTLNLPLETIVLTKGIDPKIHSYSAFESVTSDGRMLAELLHDLKIVKIYICGLATEYCVLCTTLEALRNGFMVSVLADAVAGVDILPEASLCAIEDMKKAGAQMVTVEELQTASEPGRLKRTKLPSERSTTP